MKTDQFRVPYVAKKVYMLLNLKIALRLSVGTSSFGHGVARGEVLHRITGEKLDRRFWSFGLTQFICEIADYHLPESSSQGYFAFD